MRIRYTICSSFSFLTDELGAHPVCSSVPVRLCSRIFVCLVFRMVRHWLPKDDPILLAHPCCQQTHCHSGCVCPHDVAFTLCCTANFIYGSNVHLQLLSHWIMLCCLTLHRFLVETYVPCRTRGLIRSVCCMCDLLSLRKPSRLSKPSSCMMERCAWAVLWFNTQDPLCLRLATIELDRCKG